MAGARNGRYKKLIYLESSSDLDEYIANGKPDKEQHLCVAMNPSVSAYAKQKGIPAQPTLGFFTNKSHARLSLKSKQLSDWIGKNLELLDTRFQVRQAYQDVINMWTRFSINYCLWAIEVTSNAYQLYRPQELCASLQGRIAMPKRFIVAQENLNIRPEEKYLGLFVHNLAVNKGLRFEDISGRNEAVSKNSFCSRTINYFKSLLSFLKLYLKYSLKKAIDFRKIKSKQRPLVLFTTAVSYMKRLAGVLAQEQDINSYFLPESIITAFNSFSWQKIFCRQYSDWLVQQEGLFKKVSQGIRRQQELFSYRGISFADVIAEKFYNDIARYIIGLCKWTVELDKVINQLQPALVVASGNRSDDLITAEICRRIGRSSVLVSHGSFVYPKNEIEVIEWGEHGKLFLRAPFSLLALQSPLAEGYLQSFPSQSKIIKTGPLIWGAPINSNISRALFKRITNGKYDFEQVNVVLHAGTPKPSNSLRPQVYETSDEYIQALCDLADACEGIPNTVLIIQFRPSTEISIADLKALVRFSDKVRLSVGESFLDTLGMADLLISFSSTTIEEALQNRIPVLLYGGGGRYQHVPGYEIKQGSPVQASAVYHVGKAQDLKYAIGKIFEVNKGSSEDSCLFDSYVYAKDKRKSLVELLRP